MSSYHRITTIVAVIALMLILASFILLRSTQNPPGSAASASKSLEASIYHQVLVLRKLTNQLSERFDVDIYKTYDSEMRALDDLRRECKENLTEIAEILKNYKYRVNLAIDLHRSASVKLARDISLYMERYQQNHTKALIRFSELDQDWDNSFIPVYHPNASVIYFSSIYRSLRPSTNFHTILNSNELKKGLQQAVVQTCSNQISDLSIKQSLNESRSRLLWISNEYKKLVSRMVPRPTNTETFFYDLCLLWSIHLKRQQLWRVPAGILSSDVIAHVFKSFLLRLQYHMTELVRM